MIINKMLYQNKNCKYSYKILCKGSIIEFLQGNYIAIIVYYLYYI